MLSRATTSHQTPVNHKLNKCTSSLELVENRDNTSRGWGVSQWCGAMSEIFEHECTQLQSRDAATDPLASKCGEIGVAKVTAALGEREAHDQTDSSLAISEQTFDSLLEEFNGVWLLQAQRLKEALEREDELIRRLVTDLSLAIRQLKDPVGKDT